MLIDVTPHRHCDGSLLRILKRFNGGGILKMCMKLVSVRVQTDAIDKRMIKAYCIITVSEFFGWIGVIPVDRQKPTMPLILASVNRYHILQF